MVFNGSIITLTNYEDIITVTNPLLNKDGSTNIYVAEGTIVTFVFPSDISVNADNPSIGSYAALVWTVGNMNPGDSETIDFDFLVNDSTNFSRNGVKFTYVTTYTTPGTDPDPADNIGSRTLRGISCESVAACSNVRYTMRTVTAASSPAIITDDVINVDASSNIVDIPVTIATFWDASDSTFHPITIKAKDITNAITVTASSGVIQDDTTVGTATAVYTFTSVGESITLSNDGTNLYVI